MPTIIAQRLLKVKFLLKSKKEESSRVHSLEFLSNRSLYATTLRGQAAAAGTFILSQLNLLFYRLHSTGEDFTFTQDFGNPS